MQHIVPCMTCLFGGCRRGGQLNVPLAVGAKCLLNEAILSSTALDLGITDLVTDCTTASM